MSDGDAQRSEAASGPPARLSHRLAVLLVGLVWPLIWVGGLVTTYDAGMSVPDWPGTYGYNLFLYPYETWLYGPFDLFIEHGHRLLGAVIGMIAIGLVAAALRQEPRRWVIALAAAILLFVIAQGVLGGMRVVLDDRTLAMIHGCTAPAVFALCVAAAVTTSRWWWSRRPRRTESAGAGKPSERKPTDEGGTLGRSATGWSAALVIVSYLQLVVGAQLRHVSATMAPGGFAHLVLMHVALAAVLWLLCGVVWLSVRRCGDLTLSRPGVVLIGLVGVQIVLGIGTWVVNYGWPTILQGVPGSAAHVLRAKGFADSLIITAHVATGSLILGASTLILLRVLRLRHAVPLAKRLPAAETPVSAVASAPATAQGTA